MPSVTISTRLEAEELNLLESLAEFSGFDRSTMIKALLRRGMKEMRLENAVEAFRKEEVTLSRAAELAGISTWDFIALMDVHGLDLHYGVEDFKEDLERFGSAS